MKLSEKDRNAAFALLAVLAVAAVLYVALSAPADKPAGWEEFVGSVGKAESVGLYLDARGADQATAIKIYQCGADMILTGRQLFGAKAINSYACDASGCISASSASNATNRLTPEQVMASIGTRPYILIKKGAPSTRVFERHVEISIDESYTGSCSFNLKLSE